MSEMQNCVDRLVVIGRGRLIAEQSLAEFAARSTRASVAVRTPDPTTLAAVLVAEGADVLPADAGALVVTGLTAARIGDLALAHGIGLHELTARTASLEEAFMELTADSVEYLAGEETR